MNKKILLVGWGYPPNIDGGLDIHVKHLFEELQEKEVDVDLALPEERAPNSANIIGVKTGEGGMAAHSREMSSEIASISKKYDIIHTHDWFGAESGFKSSKYSECSWISTIHSLNSDRSRKKTEGRVSKLEEVAIKEPDSVIAVSKILGGKIEEKYNVKPRIVHNGFSKPKSRGKDIKEELGIEEYMIFFVGRHAEQKGIEHLIYGFKKFLEDMKATLVIGGEGEMRESLEKFAQMLEIREKVEFTGFIPSDELGDYYNSADVFVSPSINEPFGLTISEALECGTPVVATENGVSEVVTDKSIVKVQPSSESIKKGLKRGLKIDQEFNLESRNWSEMADEVIESYRKL